MAFLCLSAAATKTDLDGVLTSHFDKLRKMGPLQQSQVHKIMKNSRICLHVDGQTEYSRCQGYVLHLMRPARLGVYYELLQPNKTITGDRYRNAINAFEPSIEEETTTSPRQARQSYPPA